jgi:tetratricopeptide (TPR) repeat protein
MIALATLRNLFRGPAIDYRTPPELRARYRHLYAESVRPTPDGGAEFHRARLWRRRGIAVLHLVGDRFEMAFQHGRLLRAEIAHGTLVQASRMAHQGIRNSVGDGPLSRIVSWYADAALAQPMLRHGLAAARERGDASVLEAYGLAEGSGVPARTIFHAPLGPEVAQTLLGRTAGLAVGADVSQCTSFAAWGGKTAGGAMIIGRNTDYPLTGYYDRHPTVVYFEPTDGAQRYMGLTSAGCHNAGICGMNESGIYVATHTVPAATVSEQGFPVVMVGQQVLREAHTLAEAAAIIREARPAAGWNFHVVSARERAAATFELSCDGIEVVPAEGEVHVTTNHWRRPEMQPRHLFLNTTVETDTRARMARCLELVDAADGSLDAAGAAAILGDKLDRTVGRVRSGPNCVSATTTVASAVWLPDSGALYVANGTAPVSQNTYVELPTLHGFDRDAFADATCDTIEQDRVRRDHPRMLAAEQIYQRARVAFEYDDDPGRATDLMAEALAVDDSDPALHLHQALYAARAGRFDVARRACDAILALGWDAQRNRVARYLRARLLAHAGDAAAARADLRAILDDPDTDARLAAAARWADARLARGRRLRFGAAELSPMSWMPDAFRYRGLL